MSGNNGSYSVDIHILISTLLEEFDAKEYQLLTQDEKALCRAGYVDGLRRVIHLLGDHYPKVLDDIIQRFGENHDVQPKEITFIGNNIDKRTMEEIGKIDFT